MYTSECTIHLVAPEYRTWKIKIPKHLIELLGGICIFKTSLGYSKVDSLHFEKYRKSINHGILYLNSRKILLTTMDPN